MNTYPYYIVVKFDAGILRKVFNDKKFHSYMQASNAMWALSTGNKSKLFNNFLKENQLAILEYTAQYQGKIISICNFGESVVINEPVKMTKNTQS